MPDHPPVPPTRTPDQRLQALEHANAIRARRAQDKLLLKSKDLDPREILHDPPEHWERARVADLLLSIPGIGHTKVERMLRRYKVSPSRTLTGMTEDQIQRLSQAIEKYCPNGAADS